MASETILSVKDLRVRFQTLDGTIEAVKGISIKVNAGETVAVAVEESSAADRHPFLLSTILGHEA
ncbi:MAG: microcin ABC transporter ATP-binding protein, partial [Mesorhizobium sp.]|nr:microcin ABC transporter ATP-binding protein [Mesorhizobium sp.]